MIKAFLFDYDGVITAGVKDGVPAARLAQNMGVSIEEASGWIIEIWDQYSTGLISDDIAWGKIEKNYGKSISIEQRDIWYLWEELKPLVKMIELVRTLKSKGYIIGLLSNVLPVTAELIREHGGYKEFDFLVLSCEAGFRKPDQRIYEKAMAKLKDIAPEEVVFLDDRKPCTVGADKLGIRTIHVTNHELAIKEVWEMIKTA